MNRLLVAFAVTLGVTACDMRTSPSETTQNRGPLARTSQDRESLDYLSAVLSSKLKDMESELELLRSGELGEGCAPQATHLQRLVDDAETMLAELDDRIDDMSDRSIATGPTKP
jgi:hypothetical protein